LNSRCVLRAADAGAEGCLDRRGTAIIEQAAAGASTEHIFASVTYAEGAWGIGGTPTGNAASDQRLPRKQPPDFTALAAIRAFMAEHSRPKDGVASARLCPAIHVFLLQGR